MLDRSHPRTLWPAFPARMLLDIVRLEPKKPAKTAEPAPVLVLSATVLFAKTKGGLDHQIPPPWGAELPMMRF